MPLSEEIKRKLAMLADIRDTIRRYEAADDECTAEEYRRLRRKEAEQIKDDIIRENAARR